MPILDLTSLRAAVPAGARLLGLDLGEKTIGLALTDTLPAGATYLSSSSETWFPVYAVNAFPPAVEGGRVVWDLGAVQAGGTGAFTLTARLDSGLPAGASVANMVEIASAEPDADPTNNAAVDLQTAYGPDIYEPDGYMVQATQVFTDGSVQHHNFHSAGDVDWVWFTAQAGREYIISTSALGPAADTFLQLYDVTGRESLASDNDSGGGLASRIVWLADRSPLLTRRK